MTRAIRDASVFLVQSPPITRMEKAHFPEDVAGVYEDALEAIEASGVDSLVGGALALNHYTGIWRHTKDLDLFLRAGDVDRVLSHLADADFEVAHIYRSWLAKAWRGDVFIDFIHRNANGMHPVDDGWIERSQPFELLGRRLRVMGVEDLVVSKMFVCGRFRFDGADVLHLFLLAHERIDWDRLVALAGENAELLQAYVTMFRWTYPAFTDRLPDDIDQRLGWEVARHRGQAPVFRGSLLDLNSFQVDVDALGLPDLHQQILDELGHET